MGKTQAQQVLHLQGLRKCTLCQQIKDESAFNVKRHYYRENGEVLYTALDARCKDCMREYGHIWKTKSLSRYCRTLLTGIKNRAKQQNLSFDLTWQDLEEQWRDQDGKCFYTGKVLDLSLRMRSRCSPHHEFPSLDRQIPALGYVKGNVVWCLYVVNRMKSNLTHEEFLSFCREISSRFESSEPMPL